MQCLSSFFMTKLIDIIHCRLLKIFTHSKTYLIYASPCYDRTYVTLQGCFLRQNQQLRKTKPPTCSLMSIARLQSSPSGSKNVNLEFLKILPQIRKIIDTGNSCAEKTIMAARCSLVYEYFVIFKLTWTKSDVNASINLRSGLKVRITADRKVRYTLLLGLPILIILKLEKWLFSWKIVSLGNDTHSFRSTLTQNFQKRKRHR